MRVDQRAGRLYGIGIDMELAFVFGDGRRVYKVPKERWLLPSTPELEIDCLWCGHAIRFNDNENGIPSTHRGHCEAVYARRTAETAIAQASVLMQNSPKLRIEGALADHKRKRLDKKSLQNKLSQVMNK